MKRKTKIFTLLGSVIILMLSQKINIQLGITGVKQIVSELFQVELVTAHGMESQNDEEIISENYMVQRGDIQLYGVLTAAKSFREEKRPLIIIAHGFNNTLERYDEYADFLARLGFIVYRFDFYGGSRNSKSGGTDMLSMSVLTEKLDLSAVVNQLSNESFVDTDNINLLGVSQGGVVSTLYAAENLETINKLVLIFPAYVLFDDVKETFDNLGVASVDNIPTVITHRNAQLGSVYLKDALGININKEIEKISAQVLIIHGTKDEVVPYEYAVEANKLFSDSKLVTVEAGRHWIDNAFNQVAFPAIEEFLTK
ncbi:alpha/beta fold hydrolase [Aerococcaceae bacterium zg-ZUI334]|uniref:alpha/beta hydrolase n=1 Tax=Aerococcaceae bacterium zg-252 TaxID=2796928 RepID=UPI001B987E15|nr:alpha/beta fold hydrolase [Aerococcaceae bacterium zg-ZUI334]